MKSHISKESMERLHWMAHAEPGARYPERLFSTGGWGPPVSTAIKEALAEITALRAKMKDERLIWPWITPTPLDWATAVVMAGCAVAFVVTGSWVPFLYLLICGPTFAASFGWTWLEAIDSDHDEENDIRERLARRIGLLKGEPHA